MKGIRKTSIICGLSMMCFGCSNAAKPQASENSAENEAVPEDKKVDEKTKVVRNVRCLIDYNGNKIENGQSSIGFTLSTMDDLDVALSDKNLYRRVCHEAWIAQHDALDYEFDCREIVDAGNEERFSGGFEKKYHVHCENVEKIDYNDKGTGKKGTASCAIDMILSAKEYGKYPKMGKTYNFEDISFRRNDIMEEITMRFCSEPELMNSHFVVKCDRNFQVYASDETMYLKISCQ